MLRRRKTTLASAGLCVLAFCALTMCGCSSRNGGEDPPTPAETTLTRVGQTAPDFTLTDLDGQEFTLSQERGRIVLVNWFATWCPPCQAEMPVLRDRIWKRFGGADFEIVSIAREETAEVVAPFRAKYDAPWRFVLDGERRAYAKYADAYIPRNHLIGRDGRILFQSDGYDEKDFDALVDAVAAALATP